MSALLALLLLLAGSLLSARAADGDVDTSFDPNASSYGRASVRASPGFFPLHPTFGLARMLTLHTVRKQAWRARFSES